MMLDVSFAGHMTLALLRNQFTQAKVGGRGGSLNLAGYTNVRHDGTGPYSSGLLDALRLSMSKAY